jgi:hypothetical protein
MQLIRFSNIKIEASIVTVILGICLPAMRQVECQADLIRFEHTDSQHWELTHHAELDTWDFSGSITITQGVWEWRHEQFALLIAGLWHPDDRGPGGVPGPALVAIGVETDPNGNLSGFPEDQFMFGPGSFLLEGNFMGQAISINLNEVDFDLIPIEDAFALLPDRDAFDLAPIGLGKVIPGSGSVPVMAIPIPEPSTIVLGCVGVGIVIARTRRRQ